MCHSWFFERTNEIYKLLAMLIKKKKREARIKLIRVKEAYISIGTTNRKI